jgi:broad specificity phosphatase PhoE
MFLYLIRHAQSEANAQVPGAAIDCTLTDLGRRQAEAVARQIAALGVDHILASPYQRALETAEMIRQATKVPAEVFPLLHEHHVSPFLQDEWPLLSRAALRERFGHFAVPETFVDAFWHTPPEEPDAVLARAHRVFPELWERFAAAPDGRQDVRIALVSHGSPIGKLVLAFLGITTVQGLDVQIGNASVSILEYWPAQRTLRAVNRADHLDGLK